VMSRITGEVYSSTKQQQRPWINASLTGEVLLNPQKKAVAEAPAADASQNPSPATSSQDMLQRETMLYNLARDSGLREDYQAYLEVFPDGLYAVNARKQLERLDQEALDHEAGDKQVASVEPAAPAADPAARSVTPGELDLPVTDVVKAMPAGPDTEEELEFDREKRAEIQLRLKLAGFDTGSADGSFGKKTRNALQSWQSSRGLAPSGYLNQPQYELLTLQTETAFAAYVPEKPAVKDRNSRKKTASNTQRRSGQGDGRKRRGGGAEDAGRFIGGVVRGVLRF